MPNATALIALYRHPTGRRLHALRQTARLAATHNLAALSKHTTRAIAHDTNVAAMEADYESNPSGTLYGPHAVALDSDVDRAVTGLDGYLDAQVRLFGEDSARGASAARLRTELLPAGPGAITRLPFVSQHERINVLIARAAEDDLAAESEALPEFRELLDRLDQLNRDYGASLTLDAQGNRSREALAEAQAVGQEYLSEVVALILAHFATTKDADPAVRDALLAPIIAQNDLIRRSRRRRRQPDDIDPGAELPETLPPADEADQLSTLDGTDDAALSPAVAAGVENIVDTQPGVHAPSRA